jgi:hypothetical protein
MFPNRLPARAFARHRHQVGDWYSLGQAFVRGNLVHGAQMGIALRRRDVAVAHHLFPNGFRLPELNEERGCCVPQRVEGRPVDRGRKEARRVPRRSATRREWTSPAGADTRRRRCRSAAARP